MCWIPYAREILAGTKDEDVPICADNEAAQDMDHVLNQMAGAMDQPQETM